MNEFDYNAAQAICRRQARDFYFAFRPLPKQTRMHASAVYAFCRTLSDIDEGSADAESRVRRLVAFDETLDALYDGQLPDEPTEQDGALRAFAATVQACEIPKQLFQDYAEGYRMDLAVMDYADWPALRSYCYHRAGVLAVIFCHVFGLRDEASHARAVELGTAMRLTTILRDIKQDLTRGRVYLPQDELARFGYTPAMLAAGTVNASFTELMKFQTARARDLYAAGIRGLKLIPNDGSRFAIAALVSDLSRLLSAIERQRFDVFSQHAQLNGFQKMLRSLYARRLMRV